MTHEERVRRVKHERAKVLVMAGWAMFLGVAAAGSLVHAIPWPDDVIALAAGPVLMILGLVLGRRPR